MLLAAFTAAVCLCSATVTAPPCQMPDISAECAVVVERQTGRVIAAKNAARRASMASTTKIMTALLLCESGRLDEEITVTDQMVRVEGSSMGLLPGDRVHLRDLLYGMMLASGNDAANTTAIVLGGSIEGFAELMNGKAAELGMTDTHFVTPSGLDDDEHYSTALDMAKLTVYAMKNADFAAAVGSRSATLEYGNPPYRRTLTNHNKLLGSYEGICGVKTGFTKKSGRCLVSCAERDGVGVIAVTLRAPNDWNDHRAMLDLGFAALQKQAAEAPKLPDLPVFGRSQRATLTVQPTEICLLPQDLAQIECEVQLPPFLFGPLEAGQVVGSVTYYFGGCAVAAADITVAQAVFVPVKESDRSFFHRLKLLLSIK